MKMKKRFLGILLSLMMVLGLMPGIVPEAGATVETWTPWPSTGTPSTPGDYEVTGEVTLSSNWNVPTNGVTRLKLTGAGKITLTGAGKITVPSQANLTIDGDSVGTIGKSDNGDPCIKVNQGGTLTVSGGTISSTPTDASAKVVDNHGTFNMFGGTVNATGGNYVKAVDNSGSITMSGGTISAEGTGSCNVVYNLGTFIMVGGTINANDSNSSIAVYNQQGGNNPAAFNMTGGSAIINAKSTGVITRGSTTSFRMSNGTINASNDDGKCVSIQGGTFEMSGGTLNATGKSSIGVSNQGEFTMTGGEITGQGVEGSKGVTVYDAVGSPTFTMNGGTVSGFDVGVELKDQGTFNMSAGTIGAQGNGATGVDKIGQLNAFTMSGGTITGFKTGVYNSMGSFTLSGPVNISGNTERDVDLESGTSSRRITIETGFDSAEPIGVDATRASGSLTGKEITSGFSTAKGSGADPAKFFKSSRSGYAVTLKDGEAVFGEAVTVTFDPNGGAGTMEPQAVVKDVETQLNANAFARQGYSFDGWNTKADGTGTKYADKAKVTLSTDITLYAIWTQMPAATEPAPAVARPSTEASPAKGIIAVSWKAARGAKSYQVQWRAVGASKWTTKSVKGRKYTITGLRRGTLYQVRVRGVSGATKGSWSKASNRWLKAASKVKATSGRKAGTVRVSWAKDAKATGGCRVYVYAKRGGKAVRAVEVAKGKVTATIKGLKPGKTYYVRVRPYRRASGTTFSGAISGYRTVRAAK